MASPFRPGDPPALGVVAGHSVALHFGDIAGEYVALRNGAMLVDRSARGRLRVDGPRAAEMVTGLVTNDVLSLAPGEGQYAAALNPKGKIVADVRIFARDGDLLIDTAPRAWPGFLAMVKKYINPRVAPHVDETQSLRDIGVFGSAARRVVAAVTGLTADQLAALAPYSHIALSSSDADAPVLVARVPDLGVEGYELLLRNASFTQLWQRSLAAGATPAGLMAFDIARIEAGRPEWGIDIDEGTIPQEANFDELNAISYTKGCYVGQEVVARVHFRGHVNRHLRGLLAGHAEPLPPKTAVLDESDKQVGEVRSSALSPGLGSIALAMVRREIEPGTKVRVPVDGAEHVAEVSALPLTA